MLRGAVNWPLTLAVDLLFEFLIRIAYCMLILRVCVSMGLFYECVAKLYVFCVYSFHLLEHAVAQLVEALRYKPEGRRFDFRWCHWNFKLT